MIRSLKYILIGISALLLNACATGTMYDTKKASARTQGLFVDPAHDGKDLVIVFPIWTSETDKINSLNTSAQSKASQVCSGASYTLIGVYSSPANPTTNWATTRMSAISANIQCGIARNSSIASSSAVQTGIVETDYCKNLLQTNIYKWTSECSVRYGTGSQLPLPQALKNNNQDDPLKTNLPLEPRKLQPCKGGESTTWTNCAGTLNYANFGEKYIGEFLDGKEHGFGTYYYPNGDRYIGQHLKGKFHGQGILLSTDPRFNKEGIWENNLLKYSQKIDIQIKSIVENDQKLKPTEINKAQAINKVESSPITPISAPPLAQLPTTPAAPTPSINPGKRVALVIGNQAYSVRPLINPRNDADDVSRVLKNAGFEVIDVRDASLSQMRNAVRQFGDRLLTRDVGLVYYAGHGIEVRGKNYFIPVNADIKRSDEIADQSLDVNLILEKMETAKKGVNILIVDACRDDPFGRSFRSSSKGLANMDAPQGTIIAFATSPGKVAADGGGRNSPYTKNLVKMMQVPNLPIEQVFKQVRRAVQEETKNQQTPWENTSLSGDFYFSVKK
jgi:hypothetical protein